MANKVRFLVSSVLDSLTVSSYSVSPGLPVSNVKSELIRKIYRTTNNDDEWIKFSGAAATTINCVFIGGLTVSRAATVKWQGNAADTWTSPTLNYQFAMPTDAQGNTINKLFHCWVTAQSFQYWRLSVVDAAGPTTWDCGRVMAGRYIEPTRNLRDGFTMQTVDPSRGVNTAGRQSYYTTRPQYTELTYTVGDVDEAQTDELLGIYGRVGKHKAFVVSLDPVERPHHNTFYAQFATDVGRSHRVVRRFGIDNITFQEKV
jgi:hypothetical protein